VTFAVDRFNRTTGDRLNVGLSSDTWSEPDAGNYFLIDAGRAKVPAGNPGGSGYASMPVADGAMDLTMTISQEGSGYWFVDLHRPDASTPGRFFRVERSGAGVLYVADENSGSETLIGNPAATGVGAGPDTWRFLTTPGATTFLQVFKNGTSVGTWSIAANLSTSHHWFSILGETGTVFDDVINNLGSSTTGRLSRQSAEVAVDPATPAVRLSRQSAEVALDPVAPAARLSRQSVEVAVNTVAPDVRVSRVSIEVAVKNAGFRPVQKGWGTPIGLGSGYGAPAARADTYGAAMLYENTGYNYTASPAGSAMLYNDTTT
jgi:hypothetical protein